MSGNYRSGPWTDKEKRDADIVRMRLVQAKTYKEIAEKHNLTESRCGRIVSSYLKNGGIKNYSLRTGSTTTRK